MFYHVLSCSIHFHILHTLTIQSFRPPPAFLPQRKSRFVWQTVVDAVEHQILDMSMAGKWGPHWASTGHSAPHCSAHHLLVQCVVVLRDLWMKQETTSAAVCHVKNHWQLQNEMKIYDDDFQAAPESLSLVVLNLGVCKVLYHNGAGTLPHCGRQVRKATVVWMVLTSSVVAATISNLPWFHK